MAPNLALNIQKLYQEQTEIIPIFILSPPIFNKHRRLILRLMIQVIRLIDEISDEIVANFPDILPSVHGFQHQTEWDWDSICTQMPGCLSQKYERMQLCSNDANLGQTGLLTVKCSDKGRHTLSLDIKHCEGKKRMNNSVTLPK